MSSCEHEVKLQLVIGFRCSQPRRVVNGCQTAALVPPYLRAGSQLDSRSQGLGSLVWKKVINLSWL